MTPEPDTGLIGRAHLVLDQLDWVDRELVVAKFAMEGDLAAAMAACAERMTAALGTPVPDDRRDLLLVSTLTRGPQQLGVHANTQHAVDRFRLLCELGAPPARVALQLDGHLDRQDALDAVDTDRVDAELRRTRAEPPLLRTMVGAAVAVAHTGGDDPVAVAQAVLDRGAELAAGYRAAGRSIPDLDPDVLGNVDFLVAVAAYGRAVAEWTTQVTRRADDTALDEMQATLDRLVRSLRVALKQPVSWTQRGGVDEPDSLRFLDVAATAIGGRRAADAFWRVRPDLRRIRLRRDDRLVPRLIDDLSELTAVPSAVDDIDLDGVETRIVDGLLTGLGRHDRAVVTRWLSGDRPPNSTDDLVDLLAAVRDLLRALLLADGPPDDEPCGPPGERAALVEAVRERIALTRIVDGESWPKLRWIAAALPPLWSRRSAAERALAAAARVAHGSRGPSAAAMASVLGILAARGPGQIVMPASAPQHSGRGESPPRCRTGHDPIPKIDEVCPGRPWGEIGLVDSYPTLASATDIDSAEAVRKRVARYLADKNSPWRRLIEPRTP